MMNFHKGAALFVGGVLFGSAGFKLLSSKDEPFFLETPNELDGYAKEIALLKSLRRE